MPVYEYKRKNVEKNLRGWCAEQMRLGVQNAEAEMWSRNFLHSVVERIVMHVR